MKLGKHICVVGKSGVGKTFMVYSSVSHYVEFTASVLKSKIDTLQFLEKVHGTDITVILDEYECVNTMIGIREIKEPPSNGMFIVISQIPVKFDFPMSIYDMPIMNFSQIKALFPTAKDAVIKACRGDLRFVSQSLTFDSDDLDIFQNSQQIIESFIGSTSSVNPIDFLKDPLPEPGNIAGIVHANYVKSQWKGRDGLERMAECSSWMSDGQMIDSAMYENWDLLPYYNCIGCIIPCRLIGHTVKTIEPASIWTKTQNMLMRSKKIKSMSSRGPGRMHLSLDTLFLLRDYAELGDIEMLKSYKLEPGDMDTLNHLSPLRKIKNRALILLKKGLAESQ